MSKFEDLTKVLLEYDVRHSSQGMPSVPGGQQTTTTADPNIAGNAAGLANSRQKEQPIIKPFSDELHHHDDGAILPYPLEHVISRLSEMQTVIMELKSLMKVAYDTADLNEPQKDILMVHFKELVQQQKSIKNFLDDLDILSVPY